MSGLDPRRMVILSGPSGVGKDTVLDAWIALNPRVRRVVTACTRAPRPGEVHGRDYTFYSPGEFDAAATRGEFLEHKLVHGNRYGTPVREVEERLKEGGIAILRIDVQGGEELMEKIPGIRSVFIAPPSLEVLAARLRSRGTDTDEVIQKRLENARGELAAAFRYELVVVNDVVARAAQELEAWFNP